jgi:hypothetical protein
LLRFQKSMAAGFGGPVQAGAAQQNVTHLREKTK